MNHKYIRKTQMSEKRKMTWPENRGICWTQSNKSLECKSFCLFDYIAYDVSVNGNGIEIKKFGCGENNKKKLLAEIHAGANKNKDTAIPYEMYVYTLEKLASIFGTNTPNIYSIHWWMRDALA